MPFLYLLGWLKAQPLILIWPKIQKNELSLIGTFFTFSLFLVLLPSWIKSRWKCDEPFLAVGIFKLFHLKSLNAFLKGLSVALLLLVVVLVFIFLGSSIENFSWSTSDYLINAVLLGVGVGIAEELVFRGWLLGEMTYLFGPRFGLISQAVIFSFAHVRFQLPWNELLPLLLGLFLLGIVLAVRRSLDGCRLIGSISLHGSLVGGWFFINNALIEISSEAPSWLVGPGGKNPNPIGGIGAILALLLIIFYQRKGFNKIGRSFGDTVSDSFKGARP